MNIRRLRLLAIILPVGFWATVLVLRSVFFDEARSPIGDLFALGMAAVGATAFALWVFRVIADLIKREASARAETEATVGQMRALYEANLTLTTEHELRIVLQKVVDLARELAQAQYGALGVLTADGKYIEQFITSGINAEQRALLGEPPRGHGLLGLLITEGKPIRVPDIARDPRSVGFPPNHPPMRTLLGVPIRTKGNVIGDLYLTDKRQPADASVVVFTERDQQLLEMFAAQAAIAIENAQLYRRTQQLAVLQERERFGMDLHDGIIQSVYAIGLMLEDAQHRVAAEPQEAAQRITQVIPLLNDVIRDIRNYILDLRPQRFQGRDV
ncbi:MAG: GAF domain-containing protein, partial [Chloroflexota bacterium]